MAKKRKNWSEFHAQRREAALWRHIGDLDLTSTDQYLKWCAEHGFRVRLTKSQMNYHHELRYFKKTRALRHMKHARTLKNILGVIIRMCQGELQLCEIENSDTQKIILRIFDAFPKNQDRLLLCEFLAFVDQKTSLLHQHEIIEDEQVHYVHTLISVFYYREHWSRPYREWHCNTHNCRRQFNSLWRFLLAAYPTPSFFDNVWFDCGRKGRRDQLWIISIAKGQSPRNSFAPMPLTSRMAHEFLQAPATCNILQAIRWGQIAALGGKESLYQAILRTRVGRNRANNEFWLTVMQFFITYNQIPARHVGPVVDYLQAQKFSPQTLHLFDGSWQTQPPLQPDLVMKGRKPGALLRQVVHWHRALGGSQVNNKLVWKPNKIGNYSFVLGKNENEIRWRFQELTSHRALIQEGQAMRHCVSSYARQCYAGTTSIWSLTAQTRDGKIEREQTIEVASNKRIIQCRGKCNKMPSKNVQKVVAKWAKEKQLLLDVGI